MASSDIEVDYKNKLVCIQLEVCSPDETYTNISFKEWLEIAKEIQVNEA